MTLLSPPTSAQVFDPEGWRETPQSDKGVKSAKTFFRSSGFDISPEKKIIKFEVENQGWMIWDVFTKILGLSCCEKFQTGPQCLGLSVFLLTRFI